MRAARLLILPGTIRFAWPTVAGPRICTRLAGSTRARSRFRHRDARFPLSTAKTNPW